MNAEIDQAKAALPLPKLMARFGLEDRAVKRAKCPFHDEATASFSVFEGKNGWRFKCHAGCGAGDEITFIEKQENLSNKDATKRFLELAGITRAATNSASKNGTRTVPATTPTAIDWNTCVAAFTPTDLAKLASDRGYSPKFCEWLKAQRLIGSVKGSVGFPVHDEDGGVVAVHARYAEGWRCEPKGSKMAPLVIGNCASAAQVHVFESQWDAFDVADKLNAHQTDGIAIIITRGAGNGGMVAGRVHRDAEVIAWPQNDPASKRNPNSGKTPAEKWLADVGEHAGARVHAVLTPTQFKDANDWGRAGATTADYVAAVSAAKIIADRPRPLIEFKTPLQIKNFVPPPGMVLVGNCHIVRGSTFVIGGPPGVGKSRVSVALAVSGATGDEFFGLPVHTRFKTLIIQNENGSFRLKNEFGDLDCEVLDDWIRICPPPPFGLCFEREDFRAAVKAVVDDFQPGVVILDPWNAAARDDKQKDYLECFEQIRKVIPAGDEAPALGIVAHTRKPKTDERATGRGLLNLFAGSYVLGSVPRSAFVLQAASDDPVDNRVVWTCCKNNDGEMGARSAWERRNGLFAPVSDFDWEDFEHPGKTERVTITAEDMATVFENGSKTLACAEAVKSLRELTKAGRTNAYNAIDTEGKFAGRLTETNGVLTWN